MGHHEHHQNNNLYLPITRATEIYVSKELCKRTGKDFEEMEDGCYSRCLIIAQQRKNRSPKSLTQHLAISPWVPILCHFLLPCVPQALKTTFTLLHFLCGFSSYPAWKNQREGRVGRRSGAYRWCWKNDRSIESKDKEAGGLRGPGRPEGESTVTQPSNCPAVPRLGSGCSSQRSHVFWPQLWSKGGGELFFFFSRGITCKEN